MHVISPKQIYAFSKTKVPFFHQIIFMHFFSIGHGLTFFEIPSHMVYSENHSFFLS